MWSEVSCLRKQHDGGGCASNQWPSDLESYALTTIPPRPQGYNVPQQFSAGTHLYTWLEKDSVDFSFLFKETVRNHFVLPNEKERGAFLVQKGEINWDAVFKWLGHWNSGRWFKTWFLPLCGLSVLKSQQINPQITRSQ